MTFPLGSLYHGSKFAVEGISEALSFELGQIGCKVKIVEPRMIKTDFGGRSLNFFNDENLVESQELVGKLFQAIEPLTAKACEASVVADVIYEAAMDGSLAKPIS
jgi:short-subunit dehydrogenase